MAEDEPGLAAPSPREEEEKLDHGTGGREARTPGTKRKAPAASGPTFSQLLAGAMVSAPSIIAAVPVVAVPCFISPAVAMLDSTGFTGQFAMTHQAVLATVTAQAQMQLQAAYPSSPSESLASSIPQPIPSISALSLQQSQPLSLQQNQPPGLEDNAHAPDADQRFSSDQKLQSTRIVIKASSGDGYNWRKYGQKQVKISDHSRSYYRCTTTNCLAKKKVEHCPDGRVTEIVYKGQHNHEPPQKTRCSRERGSQPGGPLGEDENFDIPNRELSESDPTPLKTEQNSGNKTSGRQLPIVEQQLHCSSECEEDAGVKTEQDPGDEPDPKRRVNGSPTSSAAPILRTVREPKIVVQAACDVGLVSDGYRWRKYGQKMVKGNPNPRSYYRCTNTGCPVRKHVERASEDAKALVMTYEGKHNHGPPPPKSGTDEMGNRLMIAAAAAVTTNRPTSTFDSLLDQKPSAESLQDNVREIAGEKALELGGEKALESAQALLSIGLNSVTANGGSGTNDSIQPIFKDSHAAVPVQNP